MVTTTQEQFRRERVRLKRNPRHLSGEVIENFSASFNALGNLAYTGAQVSASILDLVGGKVLCAIDEKISLPTASVGKVLLLIEVAAQISSGKLSDFDLIDKTPEDEVGDSGIWQHLQAPSLPIADLAALVASTSDNLATNLLLKEVGIEAVRHRAEGLGLSRTALLDLVRDNRGPDDAPQLSVGTAAELSWLMGALYRGQVVDPLTCKRVLSWMSMNVDLSLVARAFGLDPLAHRNRDHGMLLMNKTGTDVGVRSEIGILKGPRTTVAYAVTVNFSDETMGARLRVLEALKIVGLDILEAVH
ncbi:MAG: serine hydrolase [Microbacteriaceae bacterium]|nr:serine hydrolase [Microbacteriaceae bacterium]